MPVQLRHEARRVWRLVSKSGESVLDRAVETQEHRVLGSSPESVIRFQRCLGRPWPLCLKDDGKGVEQLTEVVERAGLRGRLRLT